jgi:hypothetical protein
MRNAHWEVYNVKWKNIEAEAGYYYITGTITEWLPLLARPEVRRRVCDDIEVAITECEGQLAGVSGLEPEPLAASSFAEQCCERRKSRNSAC